LCLTQRRKDAKYRCLFFSKIAIHISICVERPRGAPQQRPKIPLHQTYKPQTFSAIVSLLRSLLTSSLSKTLPKPTNTSAKKLFPVNISKMGVAELKYEL
jgi:hypothetical protein